MKQSISYKTSGIHWVQNMSQKESCFCLFSYKTIDITLNTRRKESFETRFIYVSSQAVRIKYFLWSSWHDVVFLARVTCTERSIFAWFIHRETNQDKEILSLLSIKRGGCLSLTILHQVPFMFLSGQPGIFPSGRISNSDATCESMVSSCLYFIHATPFLRKPSPINKLCGVTDLVVSYPTGFAKSVLWCSHNSCIKVLRVFTCMHHWIWIDSHLGERVPHSTSPGFLFATLGHGPAGRRKTLKQAGFCWNEWLNWEWTMAIWLLKERGGQTFISQVQSGISADQHLSPGCVGHARSLMCCGGVFSWLCAHIGNTWCDRWWWIAQKW